MRLFQSRKRPPFANSKRWLNVFWQAFSLRRGMNHRRKLSPCAAWIWCWAFLLCGTSNLARATPEVCRAFFFPFSEREVTRTKRMTPATAAKARKKSQTRTIQLIFYCMKVSQGRLGSHANTTPAYRFVSLFYKSRRRQSLTDHYYHTNRQIYLTTRFLSRNTYSLALLPERRSNVSPSLLACALFFPPSFLFFFARESSAALIKAQSNRRSKADIFLRDDRRAKSNRMEQSLFSQIGSSFLVAESLHP